MVLFCAFIVTAVLALASTAGLLPALAYFGLKPAVQILVIVHALRRGAPATGGRRALVAGLGLSLVGDVALLWRQQGFLPGLVAFLLAHLAYLWSFTRPVRLAAVVWPFALYAVVAGLALAWLWPGVPAALRLPVLAYVACLGAMAAQALAWALRARGGPDAVLARRAAIGGALFLLSDTLLATNRFGHPLPQPALWILPAYWAAQWLIASALPKAAEPS